MVVKVKLRPYHASIPLFDSGVALLLAAAAAGEGRRVGRGEDDGDDLEDGEDDSTAQVGKQDRHDVARHAALQQVGNFLVRAIFVNIIIGCDDPFCPSVVGLLVCLS